MAGNVWEWCLDWYAADAYANAALHDPRGPADGDYRVLRGGSWHDEGPSVCRCGCRLWNSPGYGGNYRGFRCVRVPGSV